MITVSLAGIPIGINNKHSYIEAQARDYLTDASPLFTVEASPEDVERERGMTEERFSEGYLESIVVFRHIAEKLPSYDAFVFHGAVLSVDGQAYIFTAKSGVGKTTHTRLWLSALGERCRYLNGDKPIIRLVDGIPYAFGTPWMGKERYGANISAPVRGIAHVVRAEKNSARALGIDDLSSVLLSQSFRPRGRAEAIKTLSLINSLASSVALIEINCNMDPTAATVAIDAFGIHREEK